MTDTELIQAARRRYRSWSRGQNPLTHWPIWEIIREDRVKLTAQEQTWLRDFVSKNTSELLNTRYLNSEIWQCSESRTRHRCKTKSRTR